MRSASACGCFKRKIWVRCSETQYDDRQSAPQLDQLHTSLTKRKERRRRWMDSLQRGSSRLIVRRVAIDLRRCGCHGGCPQCPANRSLPSGCPFLAYPYHSFRLWVNRNRYNVRRTKSARVMPIHPRPVMRPTTRPLLIASFQILSLELLAAT